jgi:transcriptional regulator with XRE-family HTH domain
MHKIARSPHDLGHILKQHRLAKQLSQSDVAEQMNATQISVSRIESGNVGQKMAQIFKIMALLDLEIEIKSRQKTSSRDVADIFR